MAKFVSDVPPLVQSPPQETTPVGPVTNLPEPPTPYIKSTAPFNKDFNWDALVKAAINSARRNPEPEEQPEISEEKLEIKKLMALVNAMKKSLRK